MPLARYILCVGGALLSLLFISDAYLPKMPVSDGGNSRSAIIHIHSDQKWPERIVYDTSLPTVVPAQRANIEANVAAPECRRCHRAGGICTTATVKPATRCQKARTEAATPTQNCKETRPPACTLCSEASAI